MAKFQLEQQDTFRARIKVVGAGGGGGNAINTMIQSGISGVEFIAFAYPGLLPGNDEDAVTR